MVAMELAASCRPFRKSNSRATATRNHSVIVPVEIASIGLEMLEQDAADAVGDVLEAVDHLLQVVVEIGADDEVHRPVLALLEQGLHAGVVDLVRSVLDARHR